MDYPRCRTCQHYVEEPSFMYLEPDYEEQVGYPGWCRALRGPFDSSNQSTIGRMAITVDGSTYKADLLVTPDFGCILHTDLTPVVAEGHTAE